VSLYRSLGVDAGKEGTELFLPLLEADLRPFCPVGRRGGGEGVVLHTDGAGSKPQQSYLHWRETGDPSWFQGLAQDVLAMNLDDVVCVGPFRPLAFVDYLAVNSRLLPKRELLSSLARGFGKVLRGLGELGIRVPFLGGETADLPDQLRTLDLSGALAALVRLSEVRRGEGVREGDLIVGLRSGGKTRYERRENSGLMCNGITLARHVLMSSEYTRRYPELGGGRGYRGRFRFDDYSDELGMTVGEALLSPTRLFSPVVLRILKRVGEGGEGHGAQHRRGADQEPEGGEERGLREGQPPRARPPLPPRAEGGEGGVEGDVPGVQHGGGLRAGGGPGGGGGGGEDLGGLRAWGGRDREVREG